MLGHYCCSPGGCFATIWFVGGCFAAVLSGSSFAAESDLALLPLWMLCHSVYLRFSPGGCLATGWFVGGCFVAVWVIGGCFAVVVAGRSSVLMTIAMFFWRHSCRS
jgi:hypothetical protein